MKFFYRSYKLIRENSFLVRRENFSTSGNRFFISANFSLGRVSASLNWLESRNRKVSTKRSFRQPFGAVLYGVYTIHIILLRSRND